MKPKPLWSRRSWRVRNSRSLPYSGPAVAEIQSESAKAIEAVVFGAKTAKQAAEDANTAAQVVLDRELKKL